MSRRNSGEEGILALFKPEARAQAQPPDDPQQPAQPPARPPAAQPAQPAPQRPNAGGGGGQPPAQPPRGGGGGGNAGGNQPPARPRQGEDWIDTTGRAIKVFLGALLLLGATWWYLSDTKPLRHNEFVVSTQAATRQAEIKAAAEIEQEKTKQERIRAYAERQRLAAGQSAQPTQLPQAILPPPTLAPSPAVLATLPTVPTQTVSSVDQMTGCIVAATKSTQVYDLGNSSCFLVPSRDHDQNFFVVFRRVPTQWDGLRDVTTFNRINDPTGGVTVEVVDGSAGDIGGMIAKHLGSTLLVRLNANQQGMIRF